MINECFIKFGAIVAPAHHHLRHAIHHLARHLLHHVYRWNSLGAGLPHPAILSPKVCFAVGLVALGAAGPAADVPARRPAVAATPSGPPGPLPGSGGAAIVPNLPYLFGPAHPGGLIDPAPAFATLGPGDPPDLATLDPGDPPDPSTFPPGDPGGWTDPATPFDPTDPGDPSNPNAPPVTTPEPPSLALFGFGCLAVLMLRPSRVARIVSPIRPAPRTA
jgi:hypothetical protein